MAQTEGERTFIPGGPLRAATPGRRKTNEIPRLREKDIQQTCCDLLIADGWRRVRLEQNFSERKRKTIGEAGMADDLFIRYNKFPGGPPSVPYGSLRRSYTQVLWIEWKRELPPTRKPPSWPRSTKASITQEAWHALERSRGALTLIAGVDFPASIEGFRDWYATSGLARKV
jgi:hypothetical protein